jgi:hypothetical protein
MEGKSLLEKLIDIERAIDSVSSVTLRYMVIDAQESVLQMQRERANSVRPRPRAEHPLPASSVH